ncbi:hypothetical protein B0A49_04919 [Cryomyces minteri]|uniref:Uncharacterized protein n=1 Tax=Cryomyces minteri TaxID=331657 RepID=A0A4V5NET6_9PEZI|nr:hypothetical protein B0A49_04919 [Cryomyces minteri]
MYIDVFSETLALLVLGSPPSASQLSFFNRSIFRQSSPQSLVGYPPVLLDIRIRARYAMSFGTTTKPVPKSSRWSTQLDVFAASPPSRLPPEDASPDECRLFMFALLCTIRTWHGNGIPLAKSHPELSTTILCKVNFTGRALRTMTTAEWNELGSDVGIGEILSREAYRLSWLERPVPRDRPVSNLLMC